MSGRSKDKTPKIDVRVADVTDVTDMIKRFRLEPLDGAPLPVFAGGSHVIVEMEDGDVLRRNPYSLMSRPGDTDHYAISVRRDDQGRGGSLFMHRTVEVGSTLRISHPVNLFPIDRRARKHLLLGGGIGITPLLAMMSQLAEEAANFELHYGVRSEADGPYLDHLRSTYGRRITIYRDDQFERIPLEPLLNGQPLGTHLYVCGPSGMMQWVLGTARAAGWPDQNVHSEQFLAPPSGKPYTITLATTGITVNVGPHQSMLEAIEAAGVDAPYMCRGGACGECETRILSFDGTLLHNDHYLAADKRESGTAIMPCVSRFEGTELVLER